MLIGCVEAVSANSARTGPLRRTALGADRPAPLSGRTRSGARQCCGATGGHRHPATADRSAESDGHAGPPTGHCRPRGAGLFAAEFLPRHHIGARRLGPSKECAAGDCRHSGKSGGITTRHDRRCHRGNADRGLHGAARAAEATLAQRQAVEKQAALNVGYTTIVAPVDGTIGVRTATVGPYVEAGTQLMAVVPLREIYITANYKETQLTDVRPG
jgi:HlyD family secretion protein